LLPSSLRALLLIFSAIRRCIIFIFATLPLYAIIDADADFFADHAAICFSLFAAAIAAAPLTTPPLRCCRQPLLAIRHFR